MSAVHQLLSCTTTPCICCWLLLGCVGALMGCQSVRCELYAAGKERLTAATYVHACMLNKHHPNPPLLPLPPPPLQLPTTNSHVSLPPSPPFPQNKPTGYVSRSVAGSFDNEAVAIFALITTFYLFVRAVRLGTVASAALAAFGYLYMAASWGAYVFISNLIPLYVLLMIAIRRYHR